MTERELVETFKKLRSEFEWKDIQQIRLYMRLELKYTLVLMERLRDALHVAGYDLRSWHGPGAVARMALARHNILECLPGNQLPHPVAEAARHAFIAGRFEDFKGGHIGRVYTADINSAYPYYSSQLPNLARGTWRHVQTYEPGKFAIYHIQYQAKPDAYRCYPLPYRAKSGAVFWPQRVTGWYYGPEAALVSDDPDATILEGWVFDEDNPDDRPFDWIVDYYIQRQRWKADDNPAEYCLKLIINSIYGQLAQRTGWNQRDRTPPKFHCLILAGFITASCRAAVYRVAEKCGNDLVSIDTDGVASLRPFTWLAESKELGGWKLNDYEDSVFWQSGIYALKENGQWSKAKSRGIPKASFSPSDLLSLTDTSNPLKLTKKVFISYGLALNGQRKALNSWREEPHEYIFGGSGKRYHYTGGAGRDTGCREVCGSGPVHRFALPTHLFAPGTDPGSHPHKLPWLDADMGLKGEVIERYMYDLNDLEYDEEWAEEYG